MKLAIITPVGGEESTAHETIASVRLVARRHSDVSFEHVLVPNNGASLHKPAIEEPNLALIIKDINPVACRSTARNVGIRSTSGDTDYLLFLDAGDYLLPDAIGHLPPSADKVVSCSSIVMTATGEAFLRKVWPVRLIEILNPFYIGATWVPRALAARVDFEKGRREDWKYWISLHRAGAQFHPVDAINYVYMVKSRKDHVRRKLPLLKSHYNVYRKFLNKGAVPSTLSLMAYYGIQAVHLGASMMKHEENRDMSAAIDEIRRLSHSQRTRQVP